ncbi:hypothetical protein [Deinococcus actinosclerus]|uniref:Secreted protein n=1 Tax=Deinococcus actinosclerus TaxID=1768108 RepID=A0ABN4K1S6_9DEIO|nr:hypothetical protein [Deinococcus actinosclerus]ALW88116.1 hypothetical protein AUC44_03730 [Deinococcus actinosclerus]
MSTVLTAAALRFTAAAALLLAPPAWERLWPTDLWTAPGYLVWLLEAMPAGDAPPDNLPLADLGENCPTDDSCAGTGER